VRESLLILFIFLLTVFKSVWGRDFKLGIDDSYFLPLYATEKNVLLPSFTKDFFEAFGKEKGHTFTFVPLPADKILPELFLGTIDFEYPDNLDMKNRQKESRFIYYSANITALMDCFFSFRANLNKPIQYFKKVGILNNVKPYPLLKYLKTGQMTMITSPSAEYLFREVLDGRLDAVYISKFFGEHILEKLNAKDALIFQPQLPHIVSETYVGTQKHQDVVNELNEFLATKREIVEALKAKYKMNDVFINPIEINIGVVNEGL